MVYPTLFFISLGAATILPISSEALLLYDLHAGYSSLGIWSAATAGNVSGAWINYYLGAKGEHYLEKRGYLRARKLRRYQAWFDRYGGWLLWLSWIPLIGDPITVAAGVLGYNRKCFLLIVTAAKGLRYAVLILSYHYMFR